MSRQKVSNKVSWPLFKGFWQNCVVGVWESVVNNIPSFFKGEHFFINKDSQEFNSCDGWMSIIQLNLIFLWEHFESIIVLQFISSNNVINGSWWEEVLLLQTKFFSSICAVIWVQATCDRFSTLSFPNCSLVITWVKFIKIKCVSGLCWP